MGRAEVKQQISDYANQLGATEVERQTLLGIAFAESNFDPEAVGDNGYSHGAFQAERQAGVSLYDQVSHALARIQKQSGYFAPIWGQLANVVENSTAMVMRYHKSNWQMGPEAGLHWIQFIQQQVDSATFQTSLDDAGLRNALTGSDRKLDINDFIQWAGSKGVNAKALEGGRDLISQYINQENIDDSTYNPMVASTGGVPGGGFLPFVALGGLALWWFLRKK